MTVQRRATVIATSVAVLLTLVKFIIGVASGSVALLASAIDSLLDTVISIFNFFAIKKSEEKTTDRFQYGKGKIQAIAGVIEGTIITTSGLYIIYRAVEKGIYGEETALLIPAIGVMLFSIVATALLVWYLLKIAKETNSIVIKADALHYKTDLLSNGVILISLILVSWTGLDIIDSIFGFLIGIYIIYSAYEIIEEGIFILLDHSLDEEIIAKIREIISSHSEVNGFHWLKTRTDGTHNFVEFHLVLEPEMKLLKAHRISDEIEEQIRKLDSKRKWVITPHYDPYDDEDINNMDLI